MAIRLHTFITNQKRYIQIENQPHHITGIFKKIAQLKSPYHCELSDIDSAYYQCEEDGTITFYQGNKINNIAPGIWTYLLYDCPAGEETVFCDSFIDTSIDPLNKLLAGQKLPQVATDIYEYLQYKYHQCEYLDIQLPEYWDSQIGREIAHLLLEEFQAFKSSPIFAEGVGKKYMQAVLDEFIQAAREILAINSTVKDFEAAQFDVLNKIQIHDTANLILDYNDYRLWQAALPSKSKAVEYAFHAALSFIYRMQ